MRDSRTPSADQQVGEDAHFAAHFSGVAILTATIYLVVCIPLCWRFADRAGKSGWAVLLFSEVPPATKNVLGIPYLSSIGFKTDFEISFWLAVATAYGAAALIVPLIFMLGFKAIELVEAANGFFLGYFLAWMILSLAGSSFASSPQMAVFQILYIYLLFLIVEFAKHKAPKKNKRASYWIGMMLDGVFGLLATFLLAVGQQSLVEVVVGPLFLFTSFLSMILVEQTLVRFLLSIMLAFSASELQPSQWKALSGIERLKALLRYLLREIAGNLRRPIDTLFQRMQHFLPKQPALTLSDKWVIEPKLFLFMFLLNAIFPMIGFSLFVAMLR